MWLNSSIQKFDFREWKTVLIRAVNNTLYIHGKTYFFFYPIFTLDSIVCSHHFFMSGAFYPFLWLCFEVWKHQRTQRIRRSKMLSEMSFRNTALCLRVFILHSFLHHSELLFVSKHIFHSECPSLCCNLFHSLTDATHFYFVWYESLSLRSTKNMLNFFYVVTSLNLTQGSRGQKVS